MICVTVPSTVGAEAPGYVALTRIEGGAIEGYCSIGRLRMLRPPANMITIAITQAKTGLSMKYLDMMIRDPACRLTAPRGGRRCWHRQRHPAFPSPAPRH